MKASQSSQIKVTKFFNYDYTTEKLTYFNCIGPIAVYDYKSNVKPTELKIPSIQNGKNSQPTMSSPKGIHSVFKNDTLKDERQRLKK